MQTTLADQFAALWELSNSPPDVFAFLEQNADYEASQKLAVLLLDQRHRWKTSQPLTVESYLDRTPDLASDPQIKLQLAVGEYQARQNGESSPNLDEFLARFADISDSLRSKLSALIALTGTVDMSIRAQQSGTVNEQLVRPSATTETYCPDPAVGDQRMGRYRLVRLLGEGAFGRVWLGQDAELRRYVAIKVPTPERFQKPEDAAAYLAEARTVASLDHPHIVPVHDVGRTAEGSIYVVSKFIEGHTLAERIKEGRPTHKDSTRLLASIAQALHHAHMKRLIHRDVKPSNILLEDATGNPYLADFGLAIREDDYFRDGRIAGTPAYMSPEQARGEGHRLDGRSDIFSLGIVFYELLTGKRPFRGNTANELLHQIVSVEPVPPRELDGSVPLELERICLKALSKRASDRYSTAAELADDLLHWQQGPQQDQKEHQIVPKGLRSFDADDADFYLDLLPGPRDRDGLPESIRFWKTRIEETDPDKTFSVGLIYGPSGCGKSSMVKAGLLPRLAENVVAIYIEATPDETEIRILRGLRNRLPELPTDLGLVETLTLLRRSEGHKIVIVLDQFEQWLHAHRIEKETILVSALRQCDGSRLQAVVMVRDDFAMAVSRFMQELESRIIEGHNFATIDLFDVDHAQKVLTKFGQAFGKLPAQSSTLSENEREFVSSVATGLADDGKVVSVRLALFAEMVKGKPWIPATLEEIGGTKGIVVNFLEETFVSRSADPIHRFHQYAVREVLKALLPETGSEIKGHMRSYAELLEASGYGSRPKDFDDLIRILDSEIRLITLTDPEGYVESSATSKLDEKYFQLTHDYLVPSLRDWLTRKQKETRRGRAELLLADRAVVWNARPENRQLPSLLQWLQIRWLTTKKTWTPPQRKIMRKAGGYHAVRGLVVAVALAVIGWGGYETHGTLKASALRDRLLDANTNDVPTIVQDMASYRRWINSLLRDAAAEAEASKDTRKQLHTSLALLPVDASQVNYLYGRLLGATPNEVPVLRDALAPHKDALLDKLWAVVIAPAKGKESQRLRAAAALATYDPDSQRHDDASRAVVDQLVAENPVFLGLWMEAFRPIKGKLLAALANIYRDINERESDRTLATNILADYASDQPHVLAELLIDADEQQFALIYPKLKDRAEQVLPVLTSQIDKTLPPDIPSSDDSREKLAKQQANAAVALLKMNQSEKVWPLFQHSPDPRVRSFLIHRLSPLGVDAKAVVERLEDEPDLTIRRALLLSLGEYGEKDFSLDDRKLLLPKLQKMYQTASDPGLHASAEWLLRTWKQEEWLKRMNGEWAKDKEGREKKTDSIQQILIKEKEKSPPQWYVNGQGQTMIVIPGPVEFMMGSPLTEANRQKSETQHKRRIGRTFALAAKSVTMEQFREFDDKDYGLPAVYSRTADLPAAGIDWYRAAKYCNWLSQKEEIDDNQWCYEIKDQVTALKENYLSLFGYRLPTEAEMEYATRAEALTSRYFGESDELLPRYAWYQRNSEEKTWPVGSLKPNDLGFFDVQGNVFTWCQDVYKRYPQEEEPSDDKENDLVVKESASRLLRGGGSGVLSSMVRSAARNAILPMNRSGLCGFRVARTFPLVPLSPISPTSKGGGIEK